MDFLLTTLKIKSDKKENMINVRKKALHQII